MVDVLHIIQLNFSDSPIFIVIVLKVKPVYAGMDEAHSAHVAWLYVRDQIKVFHKVLLSKVYFSSLNLPFTFLILWNKKSFRKLLCDNHYRMIDHTSIFVHILLIDILNVLIVLITNNTEPFAKPIFLNNLHYLLSILIFVLDVLKVALWLHLKAHRPYWWGTLSHLIEHFLYENGLHTDFFGAVFINVSQELVRLWFVF